MSVVRLLLFCLFLVATVSAAPMQELDAGSPQTKALLKLLVPIVQGETDRLGKTVAELKGAKVELTPGTTRVQDGWALLIASFEPSFAEGAVSGLLRKEKGKWKLVWHSFLEPPPKYGEVKAKFPAVPKSLFPVAAD